MYINSNMSISNFLDTTFKLYNKKIQELKVSIISEDYQKSSEIANKLIDVNFLLISSLDNKQPEYEQLIDIYNQITILLGKSIVLNDIKYCDEILKMIEQTN